jgi:hypothetical protein
LGGYRAKNLISRSGRGADEERLEAVADNVAVAAVVAIAVAGLNLTLGDRVYKTQSKT